MGLRDLFTANRALLRDQEFGHGEQVTYFEPNATPGQPPTATPFSGIVEYLANDAFTTTQQGNTQFESGEIDVPINLIITSEGWFQIGDDPLIWKYAGLGGRDADGRSILITRPITKSKRMANRRG